MNRRGFLKVASICVVVPFCKLKVKKSFNPKHEYGDWVTYRLPSERDKAHETCLALMESVIPYKHQTKVWFKFQEPTISRPGHVSFMYKPDNPEWRRHKRVG